MMKIENILKTVELFYLIRELDYYDDNLVLKISSFNEEEKEYITYFKKLIDNFKYTQKFYTFTFNYQKFNYAEIFIHRLNKHNKLCLHINVEYDYDYDTDESKIKIFRYDLTLYDIIKIIKEYHNKNRNNKHILTFKNIKQEPVIDILLELKGIYKR